MEAVSERISKDPRHHGVFVLDKGGIPDRALASWSMGYEPLAPDQEKRLSVFDLDKVALEKPMDPEHPRSVLSMMRTFYRTAQRFQDD